MLSLVDSRGLAARTCHGSPDKPMTLNAMELSFCLSGQTITSLGYIEVLRSLASMRLPVILYARALFS
jgi:hypothetical protein